MSLVNLNVEESKNPNDQIEETKNSENKILDDIEDLGKQINLTVNISQENLGN